MKKIISSYLLFVSLAYGYEYNDVLLKAQASIFPKIMLLDKKIEDKLVNGQIVYTVAYDKNDHHTALEIRKYIDMNHKGQFDEYSYRIDLVEFDNITTQTEASAIYVLNSDKNIKKIADVAKEKGIVSFSYDIENLKKGLLFSLMLEKSTVLYLNKENLHTKKIDFIDSLLQMVKFFKTDSDNS